MPSIIEITHTDELTLALKGASENTRMKVDGGTLLVSSGFSYNYNLRELIEAGNALLPVRIHENKRIDAVPRGIDNYWMQEAARLHDGHCSGWQQRELEKVPGIGYAVHYPWHANYTDDDRRQYSSAVRLNRNFAVEVYGTDIARLFDGHPLCALHLPRPSSKDKRLLAYTPSVAYGHADRQLRMAPGRYFRKFWPDLTDKEVTLCAEAWMHYMGTGDVRIAMTPDEIEWVYINGPRSCMGGKDGLRWRDDIHPVRVYGAGDLGVAYIKRGQRATARALVWPAKKVYGRVYGDVSALVSYLEGEGYSAGNSEFSGARLLRIENSRGEIVGPYLDVCGNVEDDGKVLRIFAGGSSSKHVVYEAYRTDGVLEAGDRCSNCGDFGGEYDVRWVGDQCFCSECYHDQFTECWDCGEPVDSYDCREGPDSHSYCEGCFDDRFTVCEDCDEAHYRRDMIETPDDGRELCEDCFNSQYTTCDECGDYVAKDDVTETEDGEMCESCRDSNNYRECADCGEWKTAAHTTEDCDGDTVCEDCFNERHEDDE